MKSYLVICLKHLAIEQRKNARCAGRLRGARWLEFSVVWGTCGGNCHEN